jgi:iron-sulfur cluster repair protein YtfE (RIC family)
MKRIEALAPLSREHHNALMLAQLLKKDAPAYKGLPLSVDGKIAYAKQQFEKELKSHFSKEEQVFVEAKSSHEPINVLMEEICAEHRQLEVLFMSLDSVEDKEWTMNELGKKLDQHIRKEERVLFPLLQQHCSAGSLEKIHQILH